MLWSLYPSPQIRSRASGPGVYRNVNVPITLSGAYSAKSSLAAAIWLSPRQSVNDQLSQLMVAPAIPPSSPPISTGTGTDDGLPFGERDVVHDSADASERRLALLEIERQVQPAERAGHVAAHGHGDDALSGVHGRPAGIRPLLDAPVLDARDLQRRGRRLGGGQPELAAQVDIRFADAVGIERDQLVAGGRRDRVGDIRGLPGLGVVFVGDDGRRIGDLIGPGA